MRSTFAILAALAAALAAAPAVAHTGHGLDGFAAGFAHPFGGIDHLLAMIAVGAWAAQQGGRAVWALPAAFLGAMALGGVFGFAGSSLAGTEGAILASVLVLGAVIAAAAKLPIAVAAPLVGAFALFHGLAHGAELPEDGNAPAYAAGFVAATALLHAAGIALAFALHGTRPRLALRALGAAQVGASVLLVVGAI
ncbi:MAG: HupE/UreJ family protein [Alphaproteobacteria bacterium]